MMVHFSLIGQTKVMSFNIRYDNPDDGENWWEFRKSEVVTLLNHYQPDFFGLQEALPHQSDFIASKLQDYNHIGHGRDGIGTNSEGVPLFFNKDKYQLLKSELFWLSETPDKPSIGWDASLNRIVVYGRFKNKESGESIHVFNCHFDHLGAKAREKSAELLMKYLNQHQLLNEQIIVMGDLNCLPMDKPIKILSQHLKDCFAESIDGSYGPIGTFNAFDTQKVLTKRIDYIFVRNIMVSSYRAVDDKRKNNLYPSDHLPVLIKF